MDEEQLDELEVTGNAAQVRTAAKLKEAAILYLSGLNAKAIAKALSYKPEYVQNVLIRSPRFIAAVKEISEQELSKTLAAARNKITKLVEPAYEALEFQLREKKSLEGVRIVFEQLGGNRKEEKQETVQATGITIVMPSTKPDINVKPDNDSGAV